MSAACGGDNVGTVVTTQPPTTQPTTTLRPTTTTVSPEDNLTAASSSGSEPTSTYDGNGCTYDGPSEFDLNSEVTFTFIDETGSENAGFAVWAVPDGTTTDDIQDDGILNVNGENIDWSSETQVSDSEWQLTVTFDKTGLHALNC